MTTITLDSNDCIAIAAMAKHVAPKNEVRYYLCGVTLEFTPRGILALATNGHIMTIARLACSGEVEAAPVGTAISIPRDIALSLAPKGGKRAWCPPALLSFDLDGGPRTIQHGAATVTLPAECAEWRFPDWRRVVPRECSGEIAQFNPAYPVAIQAVADAMNHGSMAPMSIRHNGAGASCVAFSTVDLYAVIMPMRGEPVDRPTWVLDDAPPVETVIADTLREVSAPIHDQLAGPFTYHQDPGHGWLAVPRTLLHALGIASEITRYSFETWDGSTVYLEEDCDLNTFSRAVCKHTDLAWQSWAAAHIVDQHYQREAPCRNLGSYTGAAPQSAAA